MQHNIKNGLTLREAKFEDERAVQALCLRNGMFGEQSELAWQWFWLDNPFCPEGWPLGWVLEANNKIVGFIGNIPRSYSYKRKQLIIGAAHSFTVDEGFRSSTFQLLAAFFTRNPADVLIFSSANELAGQLFRVAGAKMIPQEDYNQSLFWVISGTDFVASVSRKKGYNKCISTMIGGFFGPFFALERIFKQRWRSYQHSGVQFVQPFEASSEFDTLWESLTDERYNCFLARRDGNAIRWQFGHPAASHRKPIILCNRINGQLKGYAVLTRWDSPELDLKRMMITDLIALNNNPDIIIDLVAAAYKYARDEGVHVLQMMGFPPFIRKIIGVLKPIKQRYAVWPFWYFTKDADIVADITHPENWYASMMDGDSTL
jgi:hypothetical protein